MLVLALDTSSLAASCALWRDGALLAENFLNTGLTHSQTVMPMTEAMLRSSGISLREIDRFAVSAGPGSFTGLRIGISAIKGMAMALDKPCAGVSTLHGLAANLGVFRGAVVPVMDARREQVYTALFTSGMNGLSRKAPDEAISIPDLRLRLEALSGPKMLVGDGARLCFEALRGLPDLETAPASLLHQRAASVAKVAAGMSDENLVSAGELAPVYLRLPQAERELLERKTDSLSPISINTLGWKFDKEKANER